MKLKLREHKVIEKETDIDLPIYLYFQGEYMEDEYIKWDGKYKTSIYFDFVGKTKLERDKCPPLLQEYQLRNLCTKEEFEYALENALKDFK